MTAVLEAARPVSAEWKSLLPDQPPAHTFSPAIMATLPQAGQRLLQHSLEAGVPLWRSVELEMRGEIKLGGWRPFTAQQIVTAGVGFVWAATAKFYGLPVSGHDRYRAGAGEMRWRLLGLLPVVTATGPDVTRSAAGRLAAESAFLVPTAFDAATWADGPTLDVARCTWRVDGYEDTVDLHVAPDGTLRAVTMQRYKEAGRRLPFGVQVHAERRFGGVAIPVRFTGWWDAPGDGDFFRAEITAATFR